MLNSANNIDMKNTIRGKRAACIDTTIRGGAAEILLSNDWCCGRASNGCVVKPSKGGVCDIAQVPPTLIIRSILAVGRAIVNENEAALTIGLSLLFFMINGILEAKSTTINPAVRRLSFYEDALESPCGLGSRGLYLSLSPLW